MEVGLIWKECSEFLLTKSVYIIGDKRYQKTQFVNCRLAPVQDETQSFLVVVVMTVVTSLPRVSYNMHVTGESVEKPKKKKYDYYER